jgi:putative ABC transport system permease protein
MKRWLRLTPVARAWIRGAVRRPARALVVVVTLVVMTVGVVSALVAGDSLEQLFVADAQALWGDVDVAVAPGGRPTFAEGTARMVGVEAGEESTRWAPRLIFGAIAEGSEQREPDAVVLGLGPEEQAYPALMAVAGDVNVQGLGPEQAVINQRLAGRLGVGVGDTLGLIVAVPEVQLDQPGSATPLRRPPEAVRITATVAGIAADSGVADLGRTPNVLLRRDALARQLDLQGQVTHLHMTAAGDADDLVRAVTPLLRRVGLGAATVAEDALVIADDEGGQFRSILLTLAALVLAAAMVAAIQMLIALAEDRSAEIAVLRAWGTPARTIVGLVSAEAFVYAVVAVAVGLALAVPVADFLASRLADHFAALSAGRGREQVALVSVLDPATLITGGLAVAVAAVLAGRAAGRRLAAVDVDVLLRGPLVRLPAPPLRARRPVIVALLGSLCLGSGLSGGDASDALRYLGLTLLLVAWWLHLRRTRLAAAQRVDRTAAALALLWATVGAGLLADFSQGYETGFGILVIAGIVTVTAISVLLAGRFRAVMRWIRAYAPRGRWQVSLRTAGAYADAASGRTGRTVATFGIVLFLAAALEVLGSATAVDVERQDGGFDVLGESTAGMQDLDPAAIQGWGGGVTVPAAVVPEDRFGVAARDEDDAPIVRVRYPVRLIAATSEVAAAQQFRIAEALPEYGTVAAALSAVRNDGDKAVVDRAARPPGAAVGDDVVLDLGMGERRYELVAVVDSFLLTGVFVSPDEYVDLVASSGSTLLLGHAAPGTAPEDLATAVDAWGRDVGVRTTTMAERARDVVAINRTFTDTFALMLLLGLGVALIAVAGMLVRSARERRPYLAVLQAMGLRRSTVVAAVAAEPVTVALIGGGAGLAGGLIVLRVLFAAGFSDLAFTISWTRLLAVLAAIAVLLVALCVAAAWPSVPRDPSDALRDIR